MVNAKYAIAALLAVNLLIIAFASMAYIDTQRLLKFSNDVNSFMIDSQDMETSFQILRDTNDTAYCGLVDRTYNEKTQSINTLQDRMLSYERANLFSEFFVLKKQFLLANVNLWRLSTLQKNYCNSRHSDLLYVYSSRKDCYDCRVQGQIIDSVRKTCNVRVFVLDTEENLASLSIIKKQYNIENAPAVIVDGKLYNGVQSEAALKELLKCQ